MAIRADNIGSKISIDDIRDFIPDDHPCFLVEKIVERVDFSEWEELHWDTPGNPAYHPRVSLRAVVQGYIDGVRSGRELGRRVTGYDVPIGLEDDEEFEKYYNEVIDYAKSKLNDEKLKFPARKQLKNAIKNPEKVVEKSGNIFRKI